METSVFGSTGLEVSRLGLGLAEFPRHQASSSDGEQAGRVLNAALDGGINFLDTAACYGETEEMIGRTVAHRRDEYVLATKCGHVTGGAAGESWTSETIEHSIDRSLRRLRTDRVDLVQLHSCDIEVLERGEAVEALRRARAAGKTRFAGFSGDNEAARWAVESGLFDSLQTSYSLVDQHARDGLLEAAKARGMGVIVKRPLANGVWGRSGSPSGYEAEYQRRAQTMARLGPLPGAPDDPVMLALAFVLAQPEVDTAIVGTHNPAHLRSNIAMVEAGLTIPPETLQELHRRFEELGKQWPQRL